jgi:hypothetical protein
MNKIQIESVPMTDDIIDLYNSSGLKDQSRTTNELQKCMLIQI